MKVARFHGNGRRLLFGQTRPLGPHTFVVNLLKFLFDYVDLFFGRMVGLALSGRPVATLLDGLACPTNGSFASLVRFVRLFFQTSNLFLLSNEFRMLELSL
jgi:hypothetical protein